MRHRSFAQRVDEAVATVGSISGHALHGEIVGVTGLSVEVAGLGRLLSVGDRLTLQPRHGPGVPAEIVGFREGRAQAMVQAAVEGLGPGGRAVADPGMRGATLPVADEWIGRVIDPLGRPLDGRGALPRGQARRLRGDPPAAATRARLGPPIDLGVAALNSFATCRAGQRLGLFAGSGIGKSTLLAMLARHTACDVAVLALVGERGREVREFLEDDLGPEGAARCVTVIATSDASPLLRRDAAYAAMTVAEHFRDQGRSVLLLMDSVTRFCLALREIGLSAGEPPATRGYPPSVFAELPRLLERAGPGASGPGIVPGGQVTALFTVLVEGDDHNEPVADAVRGILDGHVILDRRIADAGRYPAIDVLRSLSRTSPGCLTPEQATLTRRARAVLARYAELADLVRLGVYQSGADPQSDDAIALAPRLEAWLGQHRNERRTLPACFAELAQLLDGGLLEAGGA